MKRYDDKLKRWVEATEASEYALRRLSRRLDEEFGEVGSTRERLAGLPSARDGAEERLDRRLSRVRASRPGLLAWLRMDALDPRMTWRRPAVMAAAALLVVGLVLSRDEPPTQAQPDRVVESSTGPVPESASPTPLPPASLASAAEWTEVRVSSEVAVRFQGSGELAGTAAAPRIDWHHGSIEVDVEPDRGVDLQVRTREALVRVVGTGFDVRRTVLGTEVAVRHGRVRVVCEDGTGALLDAEQRITCAPVHPAGLLARARADLQQGTASAAVLRTVDRGLTGARGPIRSELLYLRIELLLDLDRPEDARVAATDYLAQGDVPRREEVLRLFSDLR